MKIATYKKTLSGFNGEAQLFELSEPLDGHKFVIVSAIIAMDRSYSELTGSLRDTLKHADALLGAGYRIE